LAALAFLSNHPRFPASLLLHVSVWHFGFLLQLITQLHEVIRLYKIAKEMFESKQMYIPVMDERMYIPAPAAAAAATAPAGPANAPATPAPKTTAVRVADQTAASPLSVSPHA
jgi:hypothetical protein